MIRQSQIINPAISKPTSSGQFWAATSPSSFKNSRCSPATTAIFKLSWLVSRQTILRLCRLTNGRVNKRVEFILCWLIICLIPSWAYSGPVPKGPSGPCSTSLVPLYATSAVLEAELALAREFENLQVQFDPHAEQFVDAFNHWSQLSGRGSELTASLSQRRNPSDERESQITISVRYSTGTSDKHIRFNLGAPIEATAKRGYQNFAFLFKRAFGLPFEAPSRRTPFQPQGSAFSSFGAVPGHQLDAISGFLGQLERKDSRLSEQMRRDRDLYRMAWDVALRSGFLDDSSFSVRLQATKKLDMTAFRSQIQWIRDTLALRRQSVLEPFFAVWSQVRGAAMRTPSIVALMRAAKELHLQNLSEEISWLDAVHKSGQLNYFDVLSAMAFFHGAHGGSPADLLDFYVIGNEVDSVFLSKAIAQFPFLIYIPAPDKTDVVEFNQQAVPVFRRGLVRGLVRFDNRQAAVDGRAFAGHDDSHAGTQWANFFAGHGQSVSQWEQEPLGPSRLFARIEFLTSFITREYLSRRRTLDGYRRDHWDFSWFELWHEDPGYLSFILRSTSKGEGGSEIRRGWRESFRVRWMNKMGRPHGLGEEYSAPWIRSLVRLFPAAAGFLVEDYMNQAELMIQRMGFSRDEFVEGEGGDRF